jgi:serine/threonine protein kinase
MRHVCLRMLTDFTPEQCEPYLKIMTSYSKLPPHPCYLKCDEEIFTIDGDVIAVAFERYEENLNDFITRRLKKGLYLTPAEVVWVFRQLVSAPAVWFAHGCTHGTICPQNILIARNSQNQLVFKIGKVRDEDLVQQIIPGQTLQDQQCIDMFDVGVAVYQIFTLNLNIDIIAPERNNLALADAKTQQPKQKDSMPLLHRIRSELEDKESHVRKRYEQLNPVFDILMQMLNPDPTLRPVPQTVQIALVSIDLNDFEGAISDREDCIVPSGSGDAIVKTAHIGLENRCINFH